MTLYEIDNRLLSLVDEETGEITDLEKFSELQMARDEKIENCALWFKNLKAESEAIRNEEKTLADRRRVLENRMEGIKRYISEALGGQGFETARCRLSFRKSRALEITDTSAFAEELRSTGQIDLFTIKEPTIDKKGVTDLIKQGVEFSGARLVENQSLQIK